MASYIKSHNTKVLNEEETTNRDEKKCNCAKKEQCPLDGNCLIESIVYKAHVTTDNKNDENNYIGLVEPNFKGRERFHFHTFNNPKRETSSALSKYIWKLKKEENKIAKVTWSIMEKSQPYKNGTKRCRLCLTEKYHIIFKPFKKLNKKSELVSKCRHENKFYLKNFGKT